MATAATAAIAQGHGDWPSYNRTLTFMRQSWLSRRVFDSSDDIVAHRCDAWNRLADQPWRIMSLGLRNWAHRF